jgi:hypothetical protein
MCKCKCVTWDFLSVHVASGAHGDKVPPAAGHSVVQFTACMQHNRRCAVKFHLSRRLFNAEAALYAACFPDLRTSPDIESAARRIRSMHAAHAPVNFLPRVEAVMDGTGGELSDAKGGSLPPCIVMERGESLQEWAERTEPNLHKVFTVRCTSLRGRLLHHSTVKYFFCFLILMFLSLGFF